MPLLTSTEQLGQINHHHSCFGMRLVFQLASIVVIVLCLLSSSIQAQEAPEPAPDAAEGEAAEDAIEEAIRPTLDLGKFDIKDLRPTRNETAKLTFSLHLAFSKSLSKKQVAQLERWKHRLRDQVITATRITQMKDFQQPDLNRLRRVILIRVNRLLGAKLAEEVLVTEYLFRTN